MHELLQAVVAEFDDAVVEESEDDREIRLLVTKRAIPVRLGVSPAFAKITTVEAKLDNPVGQFELRHDASKIPKASDPNSVWSEDDDIRVFVSKGIFMEGHGRYVQDDLSEWMRLPEQTRLHVCAEIERLELRRLCVPDAGPTTAWIEAGRPLTASQRPKEDIVSVVDLLVGLGESLRAFDGERSTIPMVELVEGVVRPKGAQPDLVSSLAFARAECGYCGTLFLVSVSSSNCPNCGAAAVAF